MGEGGQTAARRRIPGRAALVALALCAASAASAISTTTIGISAAIRTETPGLCAGAERRSAAIRTPSPKLELKRLPR